MAVTHAWILSGDMLLLAQGLVKLSTGHAGNRMRNICFPWGLGLLSEAD